jgi:hypothetical protein
MLDKFCYFNVFQAVPEEGISVAQTVLSLPSNAWTQYEFNVEPQKDIENEEMARSMKLFLHEKSPQYVHM